MKGRLAQLADALELVEWIGTRRATFTPADLARALGVHRRSGYRLLEAAESAGLVDRIVEKRRDTGGGFAPRVYRSLIEVRRRSSAAESAA